MPMPAAQAGMRGGGDLVIQSETSIARVLVEDTRGIVWKRCCEASAQRFLDSSHLDSCRVGKVIWRHNAMDFGFHKVKLASAFHFMKNCVIIYCFMLNVLTICRSSQDS